MFGPKNKQSTEQRNTDKSCCDPFVKKSGEYLLKRLTWNEK